MDDLKEKDPTSRKKEYTTPELIEYGHAGALILQDGNDPEDSRSNQGNIGS